MSVTKFLDSAGLTYLWSKLKSYIGGSNMTWVGPESRIIGDTSVVFTNSAIHTTSTFQLFSENSTNVAIGYYSFTVSEGTITYTIPALTVATDFKLLVTNAFPAPQQGGSS